MLNLEGEKFMKEEQISFFDILLPKNETETINKFTKKAQISTVQLPVAFSVSPNTKNHISTAKVPEEEFNQDTVFMNIPSVDEIIKELDKGTYRVGRQEFLTDAFKCSAIAISNKFDFANAEKREQEYLQIINKYDKDMQDLIAQIFAKIYMLLTNQINEHIGFNDYLGEIYMKSDTSNRKAGQFFTPYNVSKLCAEMTIDKNMINEYIEKDKIITLNEPACGAGGMILATADILYNQYHFNIARNLFVLCSDIDERCVVMTYLQLSLAGIPAIVLHQDILSTETWDCWKTPAYIMQYSRFKDYQKIKS